MTKARTQAKLIPDDMTGEPLWLQPAGIAARYGLSVDTVRRLVSDMRTKPRFTDSFLHVSARCKLINVKAFDEYLHERSNQFFK